jgi:hypothetical protein
LSDGLRCARFLSFLFRASFFISHSLFVVVEVKKD